MNYKKIIRSQRLRFLILKLLSFVPDSLMLKWQYRIKMNLNLNLSDPQRFSEKIQWYKIKYRNPLMAQCVDKYEVRKFIEAKGLKHILNTVYLVCSDPAEIDFSMLPERFVIKTTDGGGGENILICRDKSELDLFKAVETLKGWKNKKNVNAGREWAYTGIKESRCIVEEYLENETNPEVGIPDYKFFCFNGKPYCIQYDIDRYVNHKKNFYDIEWNNLEVTSDCPGFDDRATPKPEGLNSMLKVAETLAADFPFVRVDLYYLKGQVYFGELTFYPWSGYVRFNPDEFDFTLGKEFKIDKTYE